MQIYIEMSTMHNVEVCGIRQRALFMIDCVLLYCLPATSMALTYIYLTEKVIAR